MTKKHRFLPKKKFLFGNRFNFERLSFLLQIRGNWTDCNMEQRVRTRRIRVYEHYIVQEVLEGLGDVGMKYWTGLAMDSTLKRSFNMSRLPKKWHYCFAGKNWLCLEKNKVESILRKKKLGKRPVWTHNDPKVTNKGY